MPSTSWICGSVCSTKFFGLPPPMIRMPLLPPWVVASHALADVAAQQVVVLRRAHGPLELRARRHFPDVGVGRQQHLVVEEDVVDADDTLLAQLHIVREGGPAV